ncbi:MAG: ribosome-binding factor A [Minisyncoccia bacterium]
MRSERKKFLIIEKLSEIVEEIINGEAVFTILNISLPQKGGTMKVLISIYPDKKAKELIKELNKNQNKIKNELKERVYLRYLPKNIKFVYSSDLKDMEEIDRILKNLG